MLDVVEKSHSTKNLPCEKFQKLAGVLDGAGNAAEELGIGIVVMEKIGITHSDDVFKKNVH